MKVIKKCLTLVAVMLSLASFANSTVKVSLVPEWDKPLHSVKAKFTDPYVTGYFGWVVGAWYQPPYQLALQVNMDHAVPVKWVVTLQVLGVWPGTGSSYKNFDVIINSGNSFKTQYYPLSTNQEAYPNAGCDYVYDGPY